MKVQSILYQLHSIPDSQRVDTLSISDEFKIGEWDNGESIAWPQLMEKAWDEKHVNINSIDQNNKEDTLRIYRGSYRGDMRFIALKYIFARLTNNTQKMTSLLNRFVYLEFQKSSLTLEK